MTTAFLNARIDTSLELLLERAPATRLARVLATVVSTAGSTYRKPGARMLSIMADGSYLVSCRGEADVSRPISSCMRSKCFKAGYRAQSSTTCAAPTTFCSE